MFNCIYCEKKLSVMDVSLHRKFVNRGAEEFMCRECLKKRFKITDEYIDKMVELFKKQGCTLFP